jgi:hypothetical protein
MIINASVFFFFMEFANPLVACMEGHQPYYKSSVIFLDYL